MVKGLDLFRDHFAAYKDRYVLIGGTASFLALEEVALEFRATKDLDIVLCIEAFDAEFAKAFWDFVRNAGYAIQERSDGTKVFYRFQKPSDERYPAMIELFSRAPDNVSLQAPATLTPIPAGEDVDSLSAILLDEDYYGFIHSGVREFAGLPCVSANQLIPLKAHAWLDLTRRRNSGEKIDSKNIAKHLKDVVRLFQLLLLNEVVATPESVKAHLREFVAQMEADDTFDPGKIVTGLTAVVVINGLRKVYAL